MSARNEFVLDGSVTMAWYFADESNAYADAVLTALETGRAVVPSLWPLEVANTVLVGERRKRSTEAQAAVWLGILEMLAREALGFGFDAGIRAGSQSPFSSLVCNSSENRSSGG